MSENMTPEIAQLNDLYAYYLNARCRVVEQMPTQVSALLATTMGAVDECERAPILSRSAFKARIDQLLAAEPAEPVVVTQHVHFNLKDGDTDAIVAAFNRVTKPAKADESRWQTFVDAAIGLGLRAHVDGATGEVKVVSPSTYYLDKGPKATPDSTADQRPVPAIEQQWHDFGHWLVTAFQPGKVDEAAVLHPGGKYESGPEFCLRALQLALDRGAFNHGPRSQANEQVAKLQAMAFVARHANIPYEALVAMSDAKFASTLKLTEEMVASDIEAATKPV